MLVITRKRNEGVEIIDQTTGEVLATVLISEIKPQRIKLGVIADPRFKFRRIEWPGGLPPTAVVGSPTAVVSEDVPVPVS